MRKVLLSIILFVITPFLFACNINQSQNTQIGDDFNMKAIVKNIDKHIEVEVIHSDYAFGIYWIITSNETKYFDSDGNTINREDIKVGNTIKVSYNGQVMMSYPPQIVAHSINVIE